MTAKIKLKRRLCLLLAVLFTSASVLTLASCGDSSESKETEPSGGTAAEAITNTVTEPATEGPHETLDVPEVNYNGYTFRVLSIQHDCHTPCWMLRD